MITTQAHRQRILDALGAPDVVEVDLTGDDWVSRVLGGVLAGDLRSDVMLPGFTNSAMDGYAVRSIDLADLADGSIPVIGDIAAGDTRSLHLEPGTAWRIMTGAPVPDGADSIVPVEMTDGGLDRVTFTEQPPAHRHIRLAGEDVTVGDVVLPADTRIAPHHIAVLASCGRSAVSVVRRPRVAVISTGDELVAAGEPLQHGQIHDSNGPMLAALVRAAGAELVLVAHVRDDLGEVERVLTDAVDRADVVITTGGVSAGAYDVVKAALLDAGDVTFDRVAMQPGKPQGFGLLGNQRTPVFTLPGNPMSTLVSFHVFVLPALCALAGRDAPTWESGVVVEEGWTTPAGREQYARVVATRDADGRLTVRANRRQGSHHLGELGWANALVRVPSDVETVSPGDRLDVLMLLTGE